MLVPHNTLFKIVKRGRSRLKNPFFTLAIAAAAIAAVTAAILRTFTFEASPLLLNLLIKRLLILTTVKALSNCTVASAAINTAFDNFLALNATFLRGAASGPGGLASRSKGFKSSLGSLASFALALKTFNLNIAFVRLNGSIAANRSPVTRSASSMSLFPLALAAFVALVAFAAPVAFAALVALVALVVVAPFALVVALAVPAAALAVAMTFAKRRAKHMRTIKASRLTRERLINLRA
ncbi:hypothetical protein MBM_00719 [Drepanopeziza brunnea f. sp. 'multigermtubi' MB_m1]|uniref:Uncharacterized protein n=1 Tax=Marssonina brunnea f. sp. multigermtubi (strain MB_m1) TaxID=1072389 RepID=K1X953_MARBU|nr:uncharacterized protein MBM_00719 [Drepanopeziza brunnea f. sp. 'multigermtubi' MB_m1]EKD21606.1 hypothetical protein MBM_00719 [Drepanopeziza brunnea f. sp. 'multigermtubi' MB_m1]